MSTLLDHCTSFLITPISSSNGTADLVSRNQILRHARGQGSIFPCSADHEQDWQPYPVD